MTSDYTDADIPTTALRLSQHLIISTRTTGIYTGFPANMHQILVVPHHAHSDAFLHHSDAFLQQESPS
jgi:hypothetical protein